MTSSSNCLGKFLLILLSELAIIVCMDTHLQILVGPIACGKSTYSRAKAEEGFVIVNDDDLVTAIHGGNYKLYSKELKPVYKAAENAIVQSALTLGKSVIIDRPNHQSATRARYISLAKSLDKRTVVVLWPRKSPEIHARRRFYSDHRGHNIQWWTKVCEIHEDFYEPPNMQKEGFDELLEIENGWIVGRIENR